MNFFGFAAVALNLTGLDIGEFFNGLDVKAFSGTEEINPSAASWPKQVQWLFGLH